MKLKKTLIVVVSVVIGIALLTMLLVLLNMAPASKNIKIVAAENMWGNIAKQIGGDSVTVTSIITDPSVDPHLYESNAKDASAVASADVVIVNGSGYDDFMTKLINASPNNKRTVVVAADVVHAAHGDNPHFWYSPTDVGLVANQIEQAIVKHDAAQKDSVQANLTAFTASLNSMLNSIDAAHAAVNGAPIAYTERVPQYLLDMLQLTNKTPTGFATAIEDGTDPSVADQQAMANLITQKQIKALIYNPQTTSAITQHIIELAQQNGIPVVTMTETQPAQDATYQDWMLRQLNSLTAALQK